MTEPLLRVEALDVRYRTQQGVLQALRDVSFEVHPGEVLGIVGESGCGKSTLSAALMRLLPPNGEIPHGRLLLNGTGDVLALPPDRMRDLRGRVLAMIFQDPLTSLNPAFTIGTQMIDAQRAHGRRLGRREDARRRAIEMLTQVGIPDAADRLKRYPHEFSGGMRQRIMIATALLLEPALLIADEPTSALDVTLEAQILTLLDRLRREHGTSIMFISHDLGVIAQICDRVVVMYAGRVVEQAAVSELFDRPLHPYTRALLASVPSRNRRGEPLASIPGRVPSLSALPAGCTFADRCSRARDLCQEVEPRYLDQNGHRVRCHAFDELSGYDAAGGDPAAAAQGRG